MPKEGPPANREWIDTVSKNKTVFKLPQHQQQLISCRHGRQFSDHAVLPLPVKTRPHSFNLAFCHLSIRQVVLQGQPYLKSGHQSTRSDCKYGAAARLANAASLSWRRQHRRSLQSRGRPARMLMSPPQTHWQEDRDSSVNLVNKAIDARSSGPKDVQPSQRSSCRLQQRRRLRKAPALSSLHCLRSSCCSPAHEHL